jgi:hypothetical protein
VSEFQNRQARQAGMIETMVKGNVDDFRIVLQPRADR